MLQDRGLCGISDEAAPESMAVCFPQTANVGVQSLEDIVSREFVFSAGAPAESVSIPDLYAVQ